MCDGDFERCQAFPFFSFPWRGLQFLPPLPIHLLPDTSRLDRPPQPRTRIQPHLSQHCQSPFVQESDEVLAEGVEQGLERGWVGEEGQEGFQQGFERVFVWAVAGGGLGRGGLEEERGIVIPPGRDGGRRREGIAMGEPGMVSETGHHAHPCPPFPFPPAASLVPARVPPEPLPLPAQRLHFRLVVRRGRHGCESAEGEGVVYRGGMGEVCRVAVCVCHCRTH